ncbi:MAG: hypothetical protein BV456_10065 [Thermoplasmata archaeon M8B2D]|nr:MAG: hypothetical protein BV456_10065 [Thermoplasmata archaeon M8B2D]
MKEQTAWVESKSKERTSQNFVKTILELAGYKVMDYGIEHHNMDIVKEIKTSYKTKTNVRLLSMPDFVVINPDTKESELVEIKFRTVDSFDWKKTTFLFGYRDISNLIEYWKDATLVIVMDVKPYCLCVRVSNIDWNIHFREKIETSKGIYDEIWNFSGIYKFISKMFPRVTDEIFSKALRLCHLKPEEKEEKK